MKFGDRVAITDPFYSNCNIGYIVGWFQASEMHPDKDKILVVYRVKLASDLLNDPVTIPEYFLEKLFNPEF